MKKWILGASFCAMACATTPETFDVTNQISTQASFDKVWQGIVGYFAENNIPISVIEKDSGLIAASVQNGSPAQIEALASCGKPALMQPNFGTATYNVFVRDSGDQRNVQVNARISMLFRDGYGSTATWNCNSRGVIERQILDRAGAIEP